MGHYKLQCEYGMASTLSIFYIDTVLTCTYSMYSEETYYMFVSKWQMQSLLTSTGPSKRTTALKSTFSPSAEFM